MKKGLYILSISLLALWVLLSIPMLCMLHVEQSSGDSHLSLIAIMLGLVFFMFERVIIFPSLFVSLAVIVISFVYAIRRKILSKTSVIALISINSVSVVLIVARVIGWFGLYAML